MTGESTPDTVPRPHSENSSVHGSVSGLSGVSRNLSSVFKGMNENDDTDTVSGHVRVAHPPPSQSSSSSSVYPGKAPPPAHTVHGVPRDRQNGPAPPPPLARPVEPEEPVEEPQDVVLPARLAFLRVDLDRDDQRLVIADYFNGNAQELANMVIRRFFPRESQQRFSGAGIIQKPIIEIL